MFENILSRRIDWHEEELEVSPEARDFMERLLCTDANRRLGVGGADEVKAHPFLTGIDWNNLLAGEVDFVPKISDPESTDYFDPRGATATQVFSDDDDGVPTTPLPPAHIRARTTAEPSSYEPLRRSTRDRSETEPSPYEDFGTFNFRNLPVLKQANDDVIRKMRDEQLIPPLSIPPDVLSPVMRSRSIALGSKGAPSRSGSVDFRVSLSAVSSSSTATDSLEQGPSSPSSPSSASSGSIPSRPSAPSTPWSQSASHSRRPSDQPTTSRPRQSSVSAAVSASEHARRNSLPSRLRKTSLSEFDRPALPDGWSRHERRRTSIMSPSTSLLSSPVEGQEPLPALIAPDDTTHPHPPPPPQTHSLPVPLAAPTPSLPFVVPRPNTIDCLVAGRNPISNKVLETMLVRLGCRVVVVPNGAEAILAAGGVRFDVIWMDLQMPVGQSLPSSYPFGRAH